MPVSSLLVNFDTKSCLVTMRMKLRLQKAAHLLGGWREASLWLQVGGGMGASEGFLMGMGAAFCLDTVRTAALLC